MIQRIQTIFLALAAGLLGSLYSLPLLTTTPDVGYAEASVLGDQVFNLQDHLGIMLPLLIAAVLSLAAIFLFKKRPIQIRISTIAIVLTVLGIGFGAYLLFQSKAFELGGLQASVFVSFPLLAIIVLLLANRFIRKDENTVRSAYSRLR